MIEKNKNPSLLKFAKECDSVIGIDIQDKIIQFAKRNAINHHIFHKVHLIIGNFLDLNLKGLKPDVIFLNPSFEKVCF